MSNYIGLTKEELAETFEIPLSTFDGINLLFSSEDEEGDQCYGAIWVVYEKDGQLFEVGSSHCSCDDYRGQWLPDETSIESLQKREPRSGLFEKRIKLFINELNKDKE